MKCTLVQKVIWKSVADEKNEDFVVETPKKREKNVSIGKANTKIVAGAPRKEEIMKTNKKKNKRNKKKKYN